LPLDVQKRFDELVAKRQAETLSPDEYQELLGLIDWIEKSDARRVEYMAKLARLRGISLSALMKELDIRPLLMFNKRVTARQREKVAEQTHYCCEFRAVNRTIQAKEVGTMTYSDFNLDTARKSFGLTITPGLLFEKVEPVTVTPWLKEAIDKGLQLALISEKARSELIVVPILLTSRELNHNAFSIYSGQRLDIDPDQGLTGECDFILAKAPPLPVIQAPFVTLVEAKKNDIEGGLGQCIAQMVGARLFNQQEGSNISVIYGCVTTGEVWQFLKLEASTLYIDSRRYYIDRIDKILGVLQAVVESYGLEAVA
jgi:hypothetical protein